MRFIIDVSRHNFHCCILWLHSVDYDNRSSGGNSVSNPCQNRHETFREVHNEEPREVESSHLLVGKSEIHNSITHQNEILLTVK